MESLVSIVIGVISGVLSSIMCFFIGRIYDKLILPWFQEKVYHGVAIDGFWKGKMQIDCNQWNMSLNIKQKGAKVSGKLIARPYDNNERKKETDMSFTGEIYNGFVMLSCISIDPHDISFGSMILRIGRNQMTGWQIFRDMSDSKYDVFKSPVEFQHE